MMNANKDEIEALNRASPDGDVNYRYVDPVTGELRRGVAPNTTPEDLRRHLVALGFTHIAVWVA